MAIFGYAYIAIFPFDILVDGALVESRSFLLRDHWIRLYWPFWNEASPHRSIPQVIVRQIPRPGSSPFYIDAPLEMQPSVVPPVGTAFANALRIDVQGAGDNSRPARALANSFISQIRHRTNQWWLGHAHREGEEGFLRNRFAIDADGRLANRAIESELTVLGRVGNERRLMATDFVAACEALRLERQVPLYLELFQDAMFFFVEREDIRRSIMEASVACESAVYQSALRIGAAQNRPEEVIRRELSAHDLLKNLRSALPRLFGSALDFGAHSSEDLANVVRLWSLRGLVAHGRLPDPARAARSKMPDGAEFSQLIDSAGRLITWLHNAA